MTIKPHLLLTIAILSSTLAAVLWSNHRNPEVLAKPLDSISRQIDGWTSTGNQKLRDTIVATLDATSYLSRTYRRGQDELDVFTAFYARQKAGESMHSPKFCLPGGGWKFSDFRTVTLPTPNGPAQINRSVIQKPGSRALLFYWYRSRSRVVARQDWRVRGSSCSRSRAALRGQ
jgi:EpsI family protein